ncbi:SPOSA6832_00196, partial [Sporobolomyces salmonicolor]
MTPHYAPYIVAPPFTSCQHSYVVFGQGTPPYTINVIPTSGNGSLEQLPVQKNAGFYRWRVDFDPGANIFRVVQEGDIKNTYKHRTSASVGGIVGGILGALVLLSLIFVFVFISSRRRRRTRLGHPTSGSKVPSMDDVRLTDGPAGLVRAGTFNLHTVRFTESSLDNLRAIDRPPEYDGPVLPGFPPRADRVDESDIVLASVSPAGES